MELCGPLHSPVAPITPTIENLNYLPRDALRACAAFPVAFLTLLT